MIVFFTVFIVYLYTLFPGTAPYRDTGEMVSAAYTLGIAHPPGYPLYILLSKIFLIIMPWGNEGYKLNILSALAGAGTAWVLYIILKKIFKSVYTAAFMSILFAFTYLQWYLSLVSEMYTINTLFAVILCYFIYKFYEYSSENKVIETKKYIFSAFILGIGLGIRMDLILFMPAFIWILFKDRKNIKITGYFYIIVFFLAGYSVFLYLLIRSGTSPQLNWNNPSSLEKLWASITRKTHGGTLDLISTSYFAGENFFSDIKFYFNHLFSGFQKFSAPAGLIGIIYMYIYKRNLAITLLLIWICSGPLFIYLGNMPPNPHALAILEAHFLLPNLIYIIWIAEGFNFLIKKTEQGFSMGKWHLVIFIIAIGNIYSNWGILNKRENFIVYDYSKNILRSLPENSLTVMKKDVQLFSLWNKQYVEKQRLDAAIVSQGLSSAVWYQKSFNKKYSDVKLCPLRSPDNWLDFMQKNKNKKVLFTVDAEYFRPYEYTEIPNGLTSYIVKSDNSLINTVLLDHIYAYRGNYLYTEYKEFFTPDIIEDYAKARMNAGQIYIQKNDYISARKNLKILLSMQPLFPIAYNLIAFSYFQECDFARAKTYYLKTIEQYKKMLKLANLYNSFKSVKDGLLRDLSDTYVSLGVCFEKSNENDKSIDYYKKAIEIYSFNTKAYFNQAVIYWKKQEWEKVIINLENALNINPNYDEAKFFLIKAKQKLSKV